MDVKRPLRIAAITLAAFAMVTHNGCGLAVNVLRVVQGPRKAKALYPGLRERRVAVVCEMASTAYASYSPPDQIAKLVSHHLQRRVKRIEMIPHDKIMDWKDRNDWNAIDYREIGKGVNADMVVALDIKNFSIHQGTFYRGRAEVKTRVFDMTKNGALVWENQDFDFSFPANAGIPATEMSENNFRRQFMRALSRHLAKAFYDYELSEDLAMDSTYIGR